MSLALFDLDDTLIHGDSASLWFQFMVERGLAEPSLLAEEAQMMALYYQGHLSMDDYMRFTLQPLIGRSLADIAAYVAAFIPQAILPRLFVEGQERIAWHQQRGDRVIIISATGEHIVRPIAEHMGIQDVLAIQLDSQNNCYTGQTTGVLTYREGKVSRLQAWLAEQAETLDQSFGYSDSINDLPLLSAVTYAHVINPAAPLADMAATRGWSEFKWQQIPA